MVAVLLADGFEEIEALAVVDVLRRAAAPVLTVGVTGKKVTGAHGIAVQADETALPKDTDTLVLPGGQPGTAHLEQSAFVQAVIDRAVQENWHIAAICAAPSILGHRGLLQGKRAVCSPGYESELCGALVGDGGVAEDGLILTAQGAGVAIDFALAIVARLQSPEKAGELRRAMRCR
ncbi:MAG: DJ-1/PfpI family protein [Oscillospiraceae bacterium]|nr:DJ-1/PfpI family protein [Oscillospiraceae bacterium]